MSRLSRLGSLIERGPVGAQGSGVEIGDEVVPSRQESVKRMHELSLCGSIFHVVDRAAAGRPVSVIYLQVGQLRQVVPDTLRHCWSLVSEDTPLAGSELEIDSVPVTLRCLDCNRDTALTDQLLLLCSHCENGNVAVTTGEELMLTSLDLAEL